MWLKLPKVSVNGRFLLFLKSEIMLRSIKRSQTSIFLAKGKKESDFKKQLEDKIKAEDKAAMTNAEER